MRGWVRSWMVVGKKVESIYFELMSVAGMTRLG